MTDKQNFEVYGRFEYGAYLTPNAKGNDINVPSKEIITGENLCDDCKFECGYYDCFDESGDESYVWECEKYEYAEYDKSECKYYEKR